MERICAYCRYWRSASTLSSRVHEQEIDREYKPAPDNVFSDDICVETFFRMLRIGPAVVKNKDRTVCPN